MGNYTNQASRIEWANRDDTVDNVNNFELRAF
jgi:hypothetical protein